MPLAAGTRLGVFEILAPLGKGGMGEVYRARDTKLGRDVAVKILPSELAADSERLARFRREAHLLASLNHQNVASIYGLEEADGKPFLVLELVDGEDLSVRLTRGAIPVEESLEIARQIAEALEEAHEHGIVHRDLKPANIKLTQDGKVKVLDFGLAKAYAADEAEATDESQSPTMSARATAAGLLLGTAAYMSPEQARGKPVDKRADIWAFGVVLFEMLTGKRLFAGETVSDTLASILKEEPDWTLLPVDTPRKLSDLLHRCLRKDVRNRLHDIGDARIEIEEGIEAGADEGPAGSPSTTVSGVGRAWVAVAAVAVALGFAVGRRASPRVGGEALAPSQAATSTIVALPDSAPLALGTHYPLIGFESPALTLSPDGRHLVYVGQTEDGTRLYHRDLSRFEDPRPVPGTEGALYAFFSPNSSELGFLTAARVKKVALGGGAATTLCRARTPVHAAWIDDTIYFADQQSRGLKSIPAGGGEPTELLGEAMHLGGWGQVSSVLPGGHAALVSAYSRDSISADNAQIRAVRLEGGDEKPLGISGYGARYLPSGHLLFGRGGSLMAAPFDPEHLELRGEAVPVLERVTLDSLFGQVHAAFADNGTVAFVPGQDLARGRLAWVDRQGSEGTLDMEERVYGVFDLAPNDRRFGVQVADVRDYVRIWDPTSGGRDLAMPGSAGWPVWSPDGTAMTLTTRVPDSASVSLVVHDLQSGTVQELLSGDAKVVPSAWAQSGHIGVTEWGSSRVGVIDVASTGDPAWVHGGTTGATVWGAALSPGAAWIAYTSDEGTGRNQIWLEEVEGETRQQVSNDGGLEPVWCRECDELFYRQGNRFLASRITLKPRLVIGPPRVVFVAPDFVDTPGISFRVSSDGARLYYVRRSAPPVRDRIHIVHNWFSELRKLVETE